jgi:hypothetical protein
MSDHDGWIWQPSEGREGSVALRQAADLIGEHPVDERGVGLGGNDAAPLLSRLSPAVERIAEMSRLPAGWDGEQAARLDPVAVSLGFQLMLAVATRAGDHPALTPRTSAPLTDGGLQLEWKGANEEIEVLISPDGGLSYLRQIGTDDDPAFEEGDGVSPRDILDLILHVISS